MATPATHEWLHNPETGGVWQCPAAVVAVYVARGWEPCDEPETDESHLSDPETPKAESATPSKAARRGQTTTKE